MKPVSGKRLARILESRGWFLARVSGSHHIYRDPAGLVTVSVPVHSNQNLAVGTQRAIMRAAGVREDEL